MFPRSFFSKRFFPGSYYAPPGAPLSPACLLAKATIAAHGGDRLSARRWLVARGAEYYPARLVGKRAYTPTFLRVGLARLHVRAALCIDPNVDTDVLSRLVRLLKP